MKMYDEDKKKKKNVTLKTSSSYKHDKTKEEANKKQLYLPKDSTNLLTATEMEDTTLRIIWKS